MYTPKKCGIRYDPPTLIVEYVIIATGKLHRRCMPLRGFTSKSDPASEAKKFKNSPKHGKYLHSISQEKLVRILNKAVKYLKGTEAISSTPQPLKLDDNFFSDSDSDKDLNKLNDAELQFEKSKMNKDFIQNQIKPGDPGYVYDKEVDFGSGNLGDVECDWDDDDDESSNMSF